MGAAIITHCDATPIFEPSEGVLIFVTFFVEAPCRSHAGSCGSFSAECTARHLFDQSLAEPIAVIAPIAGQRSGLRQGVEHEPCAFMIAYLPFAQQQDQRLAVAIGDRV